MSGRCFPAPIYMATARLGHAVSGQYLQIVWSGLSFPEACLPQLGKQRATWQFLHVERHWDRSACKTAAALTLLRH